MQKNNSYIWTSPGAATATVAVGSKLRKTIINVLAAYDSCFATVEFFQFFGESGVTTISELCRGREFLHDLANSQIRMHLARVTGAPDALQLVRALISYGEAPPDKSEMEDLLVMLLEIHQIRISEPALFSHLDHDESLIAKNVILRFWKTGKSARGTFLSGWEALVFYSFLNNRRAALLPAWQTIARSLEPKTDLFRECFRELYSSPAAEVHHG